MMLFRILAELPQPITWQQVAMSLLNNVPLALLISAAAAWLNSKIKTNTAVTRDTNRQVNGHTEGRIVAEKQASFEEGITEGMRRAVEADALKAKAAVAASEQQPPRIQT